MKNKVQNLKVEKKDKKKEKSDILQKKIDGSGKKETSKK